MIDLGYAISLPPADAIKYFESKGYAVSWNWQDTWQASHARAFTVAKVVRAEVLQTIRGAVTDALAGGTTLRDFNQVLTPVLKSQGWWGKKIIVDSRGEAEVVQEGSAHRLRTIYRTNLQTAYQSGRYKQQVDNAAERPYWQYVAILDAVTRPKHRKFHGRVFRYDDPIWNWLYPPNDWGCRCRVRAYSQRALDRKGLKVESSDGRLTHETVDAGVNKSTGEVYEGTQTTYRDDRGSITTAPGWDYNVGQAAAGVDEYAAKRLATLDPDLRSAAIQALAK